MKKRIKPQLVQWFDDHFYKFTFKKNEFQSIINNCLINKIPVPHNDKEQLCIWIPSVTTKLNITPKPHLHRWRGEVGNREADRRMKEGQEKGSSIHNAWHCANTEGIIIYNDKRRPIYSDKQINQFRKKAKGNISIIDTQQEMYELWKLQQWFDIVQPKIVYCETIVYDFDTIDAGTMDNLVHIKKGLYMVNGATPLALEEGFYILDVKTGNGVSQEDAGAQMAKYAAMAEKIYGIKVEGTMILHTNANTKKGIEGMATYFCNREEMAENLNYFTKMADAWAVSGLAKDKPKVFDFPTLIQMIPAKEPKGKKKKEQKQLKLIP